ncbi:MAG: hypothetical protein ACI38Y_04095 [Candidatus Methanomethylophilaceae archaeon]
MSLPNTVIVIHGETEYLLFDWLRNELKTELVICQPLGKGHTVSMHSSPDVLSSMPFVSMMSMHRAFPDLDYDRRNRILVDLRIYPVLDVDGDSASFRSYRSGDLFRSVPLRDHIIPVYNDPCLESVLAEMGYGLIDHDLRAFRRFLDRLDVSDLYGRTKACGNTNMDVVLERVLGQCPDFQGIMNTAE